jgi:hypothetical protein
VKAEEVKQTVNKEQEMIVTARIRQEMAKVRNDAIATGMRSALAVVLDYCNKEDLFPEEKIAEIQKFCEKGLNT